MCIAVDTWVVVGICGDKLPAVGGYITVKTY